MNCRHIYLVHIFAVSLVLVGLVSPAFSAIKYAAPSPIGLGDCSSWANACSLQTALTLAISGDEIWVKKGVHKPTIWPSDNSANFTIKKGLKVYGGFNGTETLLDQRNYKTNLTILSGDIDNNDTDTNSNGIIEPALGDKINGVNSNRVVVGGIDATSYDTALDGFVITAGNILMYNENSSPAIINCTFIGNSGDTGLHNKKSSPSITNCIFSENHGSGMYNYDDSSPTVTNCAFSGNYGVGIFNFASSPSIINCTFSGNYGSGMYNSYYSSPTVTNCNFSENSATVGAGMYNGYYSSPKVTNCIFNGNFASRPGGGMYNYEQSNPTINNCTFSNNSADIGGGIYNAYNSNPTIINSTFIGNQATKGSGVYNYNSNPILTNCIFIGNHASSNGGGVFNENSSPTIINCTFSKNAAQNGGGGIYNIGYSNPDITNCILWADTAFSGSEILNPGTGTPSVSYSDVQGGYPGTGNINSDPFFIDQTNNDLRLSAGSPAIDAGNNSSLPSDITTDLDGNPRIVNGTVDMGAYEYIKKYTLIISKSGTG